MNDEKELKRVMDKITSGREYRKVYEMRALDNESEEGTEKREVEGYATIFDEEYSLYDWGDYEVRESIDPHAFDECDMSDVIMQYDHQGRVFARTSNGTLMVQPDGKGLRTLADLGGTSIGRQLHEEIKGGYTTKMSFGFIVGADERTIEEKYEENKTIVHRRITKVSKLYDVSAVSLPANDATEISARSFSDGLIEELKAERLERANTERMRAECLALLSL